MEILQPDTWRRRWSCARANPTRSRSPAAPTSWSSSTSTTSGRRRSSTSAGCRAAASGRARTAGCASAPASPTRGSIAELGDELPGLAIAAAHRRLAADAQRRHDRRQPRAPSSPAGDGLPPLLAADAEVVLAVGDGTRRSPWPSSSPASSATACASDELITGFGISRADGPQEFLKVGTRNAMVISICSFALSGSTGRPHRAHVHRLGRPDAGPGHRGRGVHRRRARLGRAVGAGAEPVAPALRRAGAATRRARSTTSAAPPPTAATRCACSAAARSTRAWKRHVEAVTR